MLYEEARVYLDHVSKYGSVLGLDSIKYLLEELGNPQDHLKFIHIAGTNGKGSILTMLSSILKESGYRVGKYVSPTVMGYLERFQINDTWMDSNELPFFVEKVKKAAEAVSLKHQLTVTIFEIETAIAFLFFKEKHCDYVVLETGLGGALDATNIVQTVLLCIFASISEDHLGVIGNSLEEIAITKSGIIKPNVAIVSSKQHPIVKEVLVSAANTAGSPLYFSDPSLISCTSETLREQTFSYKTWVDLKLSLLGRYQLDNASTALEAVTVLKHLGVSIPDDTVVRGLSKANWPGRFQVLKNHPIIIADGAHNPDAICRLLENIATYLPKRRIIAIIGIFKDKDYTSMIAQIAPHLSYAYAISLPNKERTLSNHALCDCLRQHNVPAEASESIKGAINMALSKANSQDVILAFGSLSYLGEVIHFVKTSNDKQRPNQE